MALKVWTKDTCPLLAISDKGATGSLWEISSAGSPRFLYRGETLAVPPLVVYYGEVKLTRVYNLSDLSTTNTWTWGNYEGNEDPDTIYVNTGESIEAVGSDIVYRSQRFDIITASTAYDRICFGARISNNASVTALVNVTLYSSTDVYKANVLPAVNMVANTMLDDSSKIAVPKTYKVCVEAGDPAISILMSGDEY